MEQQELKIEFKDKKRSIGTLTICTINRISSSTNHKKTSENFQKYNINFKNIPKTIQNNSRTPIIYKTKNDNYNSPLMLLEETDYQLIFKSKKAVIQYHSHLLKKNVMRSTSKKSTCPKDYMVGF